ncbi:MAG: type I-E CRISPR-associated protein Cas5/CasD [Magnetococcales bacterium]|nr:type I-E CRISPR-associated protein Cas5/CasD [Magnetococcales bacterium]
MPDHRWLILTLEAPLVAFGGVTIDQMGVTRDFPAASMLTGLLANALGYARTDWQQHQHLQDRLLFAARWERENSSGLLTDTQNVRLEKNDKCWTTWGEPEGRTGDSYGGPHRRFRKYHMDAHVTVVLRLEPDSCVPDHDTLTACIDRPARPLFIGRKPCLPSGPLRRHESVLASSAYAALRQIPGQGRLRALWPLGEGPEAGENVQCHLDLPDIRNWRTGLHGGTRRVVEGFVHPEQGL